MSTDHGATARRVGFLELFFDLVFVFAVTQLVSLLHGDHSAAGWGRASLMMWLVWWAWSQYTWSGNAIDLDRRSTRLWMLVASGAMLGAAAAIPTAFDDMGEWFALPYAGMRLLGLALYWLGQHDTTYRAALRLYLPIASVGPVLVLAGGLVDDGARVALWAAALAVDVVSVLAAGRREFHVDPGHFAERHGLIVIIALGESVIATGATASDVGLDRDVMILLATAFVAVAALWWSYFDWVHHAAEARLVSESDHRRRGHLARDLFTLGHLPIVAGTVVFAAAIEEGLVHPTVSMEPFAVTALAVGPALDLAGFVIGNARATGHLLWTRLAGLVVVVSFALFAGPRSNAIVSTAGVAVAIVAIAAIEGVTRSSPHRASSVAAHG